MFIFSLGISSIAGRLVTPLVTAASLASGLANAQDYAPQHLPPQHGPNFPAQPTQPTQPAPIFKGNCLPGYVPYHGYVPARSGAYVRAWSNGGGAIAQQQIMGSFNRTDVRIDNSVTINSAGDVNISGKKVTIGQVPFGGRPCTDNTCPDPKAKTDSSETPTSKKQRREKVRN